MRCIVAGSRHFEDYDFVASKLDHLFSKRQPYAIVCGMAKGVDMLGHRYAKERGLVVCEYPANWNGYGKMAGHIRNREMAMNAEALVAFWDGESRGTKHMIETAKHCGLKVRVVTIPRSTG